MLNNFFDIVFCFLGGKKILLFCEKVDKNDVEVHFTLYTKSKYGYFEIHICPSIYIMLKYEGTSN